MSVYRPWHFFGFLLPGMVARLDVLRLFRGVALSLIHLSARFGGLRFYCRVIRNIGRARIPQWQRDLVRPVPCEQANQLLARRRAWKLQSRAARLGHSPRLWRPPCNDLDVILRLLRQLTFVCEPIRDAPGARVVGRRGEAKIAELLVQIAQQSRRRRDRLRRVKWIIEPSIGGGFCGELRYAQRAGRTDGAQSKITFLIQETNEKMCGQIIATRCRSEQIADFFA